MVKAFMACLGTETNSFSSMPTGMTTFAETMLYRGDATAHTPATFSLPLHIWRRNLEARQGVVVEGLAAFASPSGPTVRHVYESLRDELLADLERALPVDMVLLAMHGAMTADGYDDCEGDLLARVRAMVGPGVVIGGELDLHCSLTAKMVDNADVLVLFKEYPHVDVGPRAQEVFDLALATLEGRIKPVMAVHDCRMISMWRTTVEPMAGIVREMQAAEGQGPILSVSFAHGFPWQDVADTSAKMLVVGNGDKAAAQTTAKAFADKIWDHREATSPTLLTVEQALTKAAAVRPGAAGPLVLADVADNAGGGAPSDSTFILAAALDRGTRDLLMGFFWDPLAVRICEEAGEGATLALRIGGKCGPTSGDPVDVTVTVRRILPGAMQTFGDSRNPMGTAVWISTAQGIDLVATSKRTQPFHIDGFTQLGIVPTDYSAIVVKSIQHFYAGFVGIASAVEYVAAEGAIPPDFASIPYQTFTADYWPKSAGPF